jgi:hypothetical protein
MSGRLARVPAGVVSAFEFLLLGPLAAVLLLGVIPRAFEIESACVGRFGVVGTVGDTYVAAVGALATLGWLGTFLGVLYAGIAENRVLVVLLPALWFGCLVLGALAAAIVIGPALCPT